MKKALIMAGILIFSRLLVAQELNVDALLGETWYGLYLNGEKAGYALNATRKNDAGEVVLVEDAHFQLSMAGVKQDMHIFTERTYLPSGDLKTIISRVTDLSGASEFNATVNGDTLSLISVVSGNSSEVTLPKPSESLRDALKHAQWVQGKPQIGDTLQFSIFEPMYQKEIAGVSRIAGMEERVLDGVVTKVYQVETSLDLMGLESVSYVAEDGTTLEDVVAGIITMRVEPEKDAKDVDYKNDVIVSNAALVDKPIARPRNRESLELLLRGPLKQENILNDAHQHIELQGDAFHFVSTRVHLEGFPSVSIPITEESVKQWLEPTVFIQSDNPKLQEKAKEIVGDEKDALTISNTLCAWVHDNMRSTFSARLSNALEVLDSLEGDCTEHSVLFIGLARAAGLPAREVAGLIYVEGVQPGFYFHQWAKVWVGKWIDVDPTFDQPIADVTHIKLAEGDLFHQTRLIPVIGNLKIEVLDIPAPQSEETPAQVEESVSEEGAEEVTDQSPEQKQVEEESGSEQGAAEAAEPVEELPAAVSSAQVEETVSESEASEAVEVEQQSGAENMQKQIVEDVTVQGAPADESLPASPDTETTSEAAGS